MYKRSYFSNQFSPIMCIARKRYDAIAEIKGSNDYPDIEGVVRFYQTKDGVIVYADIDGLPTSDNICNSNIFGFHIHEGTSCSGNMNDSFSDAMSHYNINGCSHPYHAGDMPPLFENNGRAIMMFLTNRFSVNEVSGKAIIIHDNVDDFTTQPSGNSGTKIACGIIKR